MTSIPDVFDALENEYSALERVLDELDEKQLGHASACPGWSVLDVVLHLAQTEELVVASCSGEGSRETLPIQGTTADEVVAGWVEAERGAPARDVVERWKTARRAALDALRSADPDSALRWIAAPLKPRTLATTRLSEHWIHALDITGPLGISHPDDERLWHLARLAHRTLPYAFARAGRGEAPEVRLELDAPGGDTWTFGPDDAPCRITGSAGEFCRVAARRWTAAEAASLVASGPGAEDVLELVRLYA